MKRVDRYVLGELLLPFAAGVAFFVVLVMGLDLLSRVFNLLLRQDFPVGKIIIFFLYNIPRLVAYVLPMAVMYGTLSAIGRLSSDAELDAVNAGGIGFRRLSAPLLLFGALVSVSTFVLNETIVPRANAAATRLVFEHAQKAESGRYFLFAIPDQESGLPLAAIISASTYDPARRTLTKVAVVQFQDGQPVAYLEAPSARWEGTELVADFTFTQREPNSTRQWRASPRIDIGVPQIFVDIQEAKPNDMTLRELRKSIAGIRVAKPLPQKRLHQFLTELHLRIAAPFCALAFVLVGAPLGVRPQRSTAGLNLGMSMVIIFLYYLFSNVSTIMGRAGQMAPWLAAWMANIVLFTVGGYLYTRVFR